MGIQGLSIIVTISLVVIGVERFACVYECSSILSALLRQSALNSDIFWKWAGECTLHPESEGP
jgi:hypothetical protein